MEFIFSKYQHLLLHQTKHLPGSDLLLHSVNFCTAEPYLCLWWAERGDVQSSPEPAISPANSPVPLLASRADADLPWPRWDRLAAALHKAHIYKPIHSKPSLSLRLQRKPSVQNLVHTLFRCIDMTPPFTVKQFWLIRSGRWMNTLLSVNHKSTLDKKTPDRTSLSSALTILSEISCLSRNWTAAAEAIFVYFSKICFSNINVKKLRIMGFEALEFHSTCSLSWFLN